MTAAIAAHEVGDTTNHHGSHRQLVQAISRPTPAKVDAIIVPTGRPVAYLHSAMSLAKYHDCPLLVLCSIRSATDLAKQMARKAGIEIIAINTDKVPTGVTPDFRTTALLRETKFARRTDTSYKRNLGLYLAWMAGWERVVFLDDDIKIPQPADLAGAAGALGHFASVGLTIKGFPDNSVVCHAYREAGGAQDTFIGGGALAVGVESFNSFFPNIYNEDWFFLLSDNGLRQSALTDGIVSQEPYDPYRNTARARSEELGDSLAEGLFSLLDENQPLTAATHSFWLGFLAKRRAFIRQVIAMVGNAALPSLERGRMIEALKASIGRNMVIDPQLCVDFMEAWLADRQVWRDLIHGTDRGVGVERALINIGGLALVNCHQPAS